jgi:hypothetical protein
VNRPTALVAACAAFVLTAFAGALALAPTPALASPDAQVDQTVRPNFGGLITPPLKRHRPERWSGWRGSYRGGGGYGASWYGGNGGSGYNQRPPYRVYDSLTVDCADPQGGSRPVNDAIQALRDGGILYIRSRGGVCHETIYIDHPVIIAGEGVPTFAAGPNPSPASFSPAPGEGCVLVASGVQGVELRDLVFSADQGGRNACVAAWDSNVALVRTKIHYSGDSSAVYVSGGQLIVRDSDLDGRTFDATLAVDSAVVDISRTRIVGEQAAVDIAPGPGDSKISGSGLMARTQTEPGSIGLNIRGLHSGSGMLRVSNSVVCGWRIGVNLDRGAEAQIARSQICDALRGVWSEGADLTLWESAIEADDTGVYVSGGQANIQRNRIYGVQRAGIYVERGTQATVLNNWVYADECRRFGWGNGQYCVDNRRLPPSLKDQDRMWKYDREYWDFDGYDRGYDRDGGAPFEVGPPPAPPKPREPWWKRHGDRH